MSAGFQVGGQSAATLFTLKLHPGDGMALVAMTWENGKPPKDFVGFAIEYKEPGGDKFYALKNRLCFPNADGGVNPNQQSTRLSPIQKFRWVHFPRNAELAGEFLYQVTPVFMNDADELSYGEPQQAGRKTFELSQSLSEKWLESDIAEKRPLLEIVVSNCSLDGATLVPQTRKPFDILVEGLQVQSNRDDGTPIEPFIAGAVIVTVGE